MTTSHTSTATRAVLTVALALALLAGCGGEGEIHSPPVVSAPPPPPPPIVSVPVTPPCTGAQPLLAECSKIEFQVYSASGALADAKAGILIQADTGWSEPYDYWNWLGELRSDAAGYFVTKPLPPATLTVLSYALPEYTLQPCAAIIKSPSAAVTQIELFSWTAAANSAEALRPSNATEPSLAGTVYEMTSEGRKAVSNAYMLVGYPSTDPYWWFDGPGIATTRSSREGRFYLCGLPPDFQIFVSKSEFFDVTVHSGAVSSSAPLDIELKRRGT